MCSLNNAIELYREEAEKEDKRYMIVKRVNNVNIPLKNKGGNIEYFNNMEEANIDRIYHQTDYTELLKVMEI